MPLGLGVPLVVTGVLKIVYDVSLFALFRARPAPEEIVSVDTPDPSAATVTVRFRRLSWACAP